MAAHGASSHFPSHTLTIEGWPRTQVFMVYSPGPWPNGQGLVLGPGLQLLKLLSLIWSCYGGRRSMALLQPKQGAAMATEEASSSSLSREVPWPEIDVLLRPQQCQKGAAGSERVVNSSGSSKDRQLSGERSFSPGHDSSVRMQGLLGGRTA